MEKCCIQCVVSGFVFLTSVVFAADDWDFFLDIQGESGRYLNSQFRDSILSAGLFVRADHDKGGFSVGYNRTRVNFKSGVGDIDQDDWFFSGYAYYQPAKSWGSFTTHLNVYWIDNNDPSQFSDNVIVLAPQLSWINRNQSLYLDLGFARSIYQQNLDIDQLTPTIGFALNHGYDWIRLRSYLIHASDSLRSQGKTETIAIETIWTHYFGAEKPFGLLDNIRFSVLAGERVFAVDGDTAEVFNLSNIQKGTVSLSSQWLLTENQKILFGASLSRYKNRFIGDTYILPVLFADYSISF